MNNFYSCCYCFLTFPPGIPNDETLQSLAAAAREIDSHLSKDEKVPELGNFFSASKSSSDYFEDKQLFQKKTTIPIPDALVEQYRNILFLSLIC